MKERVVLSGSHGFLGSHLAMALLHKGYQVEPITRELLYSPNQLREFLQAYKPDYIFHLAAYGNMSNQKDEAMIVLANVIGTFNLLKESEGILYKSFINFGSSSEYGRKQEAMKETDALNPETLYGASKAAATHLAYAFAHLYDRPITTIRPFSVYGPGEAEFRFIPTVIRNMIQKTPFPLEKEAKHDWIYVDDFIEGVITVAQKGYKAPKIVNIGSGRMHTNKEVCELLKQITGIQYLATGMVGMRPNDSDIWMSDNTQIANLGWFPKTMLKEGLQKTFDFYKDKYDK